MIGAIISLLIYMQCQRKSLETLTGQPRRAQLVEHLPRGPPPLPHQRSGARGCPQYRAARGPQAGIDPCVICAGCSARLSTPPSDSASVNRRVVVRNFSAAACPPAIRNEIIPLNGNPSAGGGASSAPPMKRRAWGAQHAPRERIFCAASTRSCRAARGRSPRRRPARQRVHARRRARSARAASCGGAASSRRAARARSRMRSARRRLRSAGSAAFRRRRLG